MTRRLITLVFLLILIIFSLSLTLLARQNDRIRRYEEELFQKDQNLVSVRREVREEEMALEDLHEEIISLTGGEKGGKTAFLTFDDGPSRVTKEVLDILAEKQVPAVFFINGINLSSGTRRLLPRAVEEGHIIANHTYSHDYDRIYKTADGFMDDFIRNEELIREISGTRSMFFRFPGGSRNSASLTPEGALVMEDIKGRLTRLGYVYVDWNVTSGEDDPEKLLVLLEDQALWRNRAVILLHDRSDRRVIVDVLPRFIDEMRAAGFTFELFDPALQVVQF